MVREEPDSAQKLPKRAENGQENRCTEWCAIIILNMATFYSNFIVIVEIVLVKFKLIKVDQFVIIEFLISKINFYYIKIEFFNKKSFKA